MGHKTIGILQPVYLPWLGYFEQLARVDHFVFFDDVQYTRRDWRNRNRILSKDGPLWLTVPVHAAGMETPINAVRIRHTHPWRRKHQRSIAQSYHRAPFRDDFLGEIDRVLATEWEMIADLDMAFVQAIARYLRIETETSISSDCLKEREFYDSVEIGERDPRVFARNMRIIEICRQHGADRFYEGAKAVSFIDMELFARFGIEVVFQDYQHPEYPQTRPGFESHMSAIDLIFNTGPRAREILLSSPAPW